MESSIMDKQFDSEFELMRNKLFSDGDSTNIQIKHDYMTISSNLTNAELIQQKCNRRIEFLNSLRKRKQGDRDHRISQLRATKRQMEKSVSTIFSTCSMRDLQFKRRLDLQKRTVSRRLQELIFECCGEIEKVCLQSTLQSLSTDETFDLNKKKVLFKRAWLQFLARIQDDSLGLVRCTNICSLKQTSLFQSIQKSFRKEIAKELSKPTHVLDFESKTFKKQHSKKVITDRFESKDGASSTSGNSTERSISSSESSTRSYEKIPESSIEIVSIALVDSSSAKSLAMGAHRGADGSSCKIKRQRPKSSNSNASSNSSLPITPSNSKEHIFVGETGAKGMLERIYDNIGMTVGDDFMSNYVLSETQDSKAPNTLPYFRRMQPGVKRFANYDACKLLSSKVIEWMLPPLFDQHYAVPTTARLYFCLQDRAHQIARLEKNDQRQRRNSIANIVGQDEPKKDLCCAHISASIIHYLEYIYSQSKLNANERKNMDKTDPLAVSRSSNKHRVSTEAVSYFSKSCSLCECVDGSTPRTFCCAKQIALQFPDVLMVDDDEENDLIFCPATVHNLIETKRFSYLDVTSFQNPDRKAIREMYNPEYIKRNTVPQIYVLIPANERNHYQRQLIPLPDEILDELVHVYILRQSVFISHQSTLNNGSKSNKRIKVASDVLLDQAGSKCVVKRNPTPVCAIQYWELIKRCFTKKDQVFGFALINHPDSTMVISGKQPSRQSMSSLLPHGFDQVPGKFSTSIVLFTIGTPDMSKKKALEDGAAGCTKLRLKNVLCDWRSCLASVTDFRHLAIKENSTYKYRLCSHHMRVVDRLICVPHGIQEIKRHLSKNSANVYQKLLKAQDQSKKDRDKALIGASSLVSELLNHKLANTIKGFCNKAAAAARPKRGKVEISGKERLKQLKSDQKKKFKEGSILEKVAEVESRVTVELSEFEKLNIFPSEELSAIRSEYAFLSEQRSLLIEENASSDGKINSRKKSTHLDWSDFMLHRYDSILNDTNLSNNPTEVKDKRLEKIHNISLLELEFSLRKFAILSTKRRSITNSRKLEETNESNASVAERSSDNTTIMHRTSNNLEPIRIRSSLPNRKQGKLKATEKKTAKYSQELRKHNLLYQR